MKLLEAVRYALQIFEQAGVDDPLADAETLVFHTAATERLSAYIENPEIGSVLFSKIKKLAARRAKGEPVQYITGQVDFCGLTISVGKGVLIPRPETELLVQEAVKIIKTGSTCKGQPVSPPACILDLCTGSGCIACAVAREFPDAEVIATDISQKALNYAQKNAELNAVHNIRFYKGPLFRPLSPERKFDLIVSNPPYIASEEISGLQREVKDWEPVAALDGGPGGLSFYRKIFSDAGQYLKPEGTIIMELGYDQAASVTELAHAHGFSKIEIVNDFAGIGRIIKAKG